MAEAGLPDTGGKGHILTLYPVWASMNLKNIRQACLDRVRERNRAPEGGVGSFLTPKIRLLSAQLQPFDRYRQTEEFNGVGALILISVIGLLWG